MKRVRSVLFRGTVPSDIVTQRVLLPVSVQHVDRVQPRTRLFDFFPVVYCLT